MVTKTEGQHKGEFLVSEANGSLSREVGTVSSGQTITDGDVVALSGGELVRSTGAASSEVIVGIAYGDYDASAADVPGAVYIARYAEVKRALVYQNGSSAVDADTEAELLTLGIRLR